MNKKYVYGVLETIRCSLEDLINCEDVDEERLLNLVVDLQEEFKGEK